MLIQSEETGHDLLNNEVNRGVMEVDVNYSFFLSGPFPLHCQSSVDNALKLLW